MGIHFTWHPVVMVGPPLRRRLKGVSGWGGQNKVAFKINHRRSRKVTVT